MTPLERYNLAVERSKARCGAEIHRARARHDRRVSAALSQLGRELAAEAAPKADGEVVS